jgi:hypothetical protein
MKATLIFALIGLTAGPVIDAQSNAQPANTPPSSSSQTTPSPAHQALAKSEASPTAKPADVAPNTYHGAQGKKTDPGTACSTARVKKDGSLDCGMSGKAAVPVRSK